MQRIVTRPGINLRHRLAHRLRYGYVFHQPSGSTPGIEVTNAGFDPVFDSYPGGTATYNWITEEGRPVIELPEFGVNRTGVDLGTPSQGLIDTSTGGNNGNQCWAFRIRLTSDKDSVTIASKKGTSATNEFELKIIAYATSAIVSYKTGGTLTKDGMGGYILNDDVWRTYVINARGGTFNTWVDNVKTSSVFSYTPPATPFNVKGTIFGHFDDATGLLNTLVGAAEYIFYWDRSLSDYEIQHVHEDLDDLLSLEAPRRTFHVISGEQSTSLPKLLSTATALDATAQAPTFSSWAEIDTSPTNSYKDTTVSAGTTYQYKVTAESNDAQESADSNIVETTPGNAVLTPLAADAEIIGNDPAVVSDVLNVTPAVNFGQFEAFSPTVIVGLATQVYLAFEETYQLLNAEISIDQAVINFEVGQFNLFKIDLPRNRWIAERCEWPYKKIGECDYGRDEFRGTSRVNLKTIGDGESGVQGWRVLNSANASEIEIDGANDRDHLRVVIPFNVAAIWTINSVNAPVVYKRFAATDFDVEISVKSFDKADFESSGLYVSDDLDSPSTWVSIRREIDTGERFVTITVLDPGESVGEDPDEPSTGVDPTETTIYSVKSDDGILRIKKTGTFFEFYHKLLENEEWTDSHKVATTTLVDLDGVDLRMMLVSQTISAQRSGDYIARYDYFRLLSGGLPTCDRTRDGPNGCTFHENTRRFGGAPGTIRGPFIV